MNNNKTQIQKVICTQKTVLNVIDFWYTKINLTQMWYDEFNQLTIIIKNSLQTKSESKIYILIQIWYSSIPQYILQVKNLHRVEYLNVI